MAFRSISPGVSLTLFFQRGATPLCFTWWKTNPCYQAITIVLMESSCQMPPLSLRLHNENGKKKVKSTQGTLAASWGCDLCQSRRKENSTENVWSGWGIALFLFLSAHTESIGDLNHSEDPSGCPFQFTQPVFDSTESGLGLPVAGSRASVGLM